MQSVIGLLRFEADPRSSIGELKEAGFDETEIRLLTQTSAIRKLFDCDPVCVVVRYTAWGAALGIAIYGLFGLLAGWCECNLLGFGQIYGFGAFLGVLLGGVFVGGSLGLIVGVAESEEDTQLYVQGAQFGRSVIVVNATEENAEVAKRILEHEFASGVKIL